jgi:hypothetical protein
LIPAIGGAPFVDLVEQTDDLGRRGGRNYVGDVVPSGAVLHHAMGRDHRPMKRSEQWPKSKTPIDSEKISSSCGVDIRNFVLRSVRQHACRRTSGERSS